MVVDLDFETVERAEAFRRFPENRVWAVERNSPAPAGVPETAILETSPADRRRRSDARRRPSTPRFAGSPAGYPRVMSTPVPDPFPPVEPPAPAPAPFPPVDPDPDVPVPPQPPPIPDPVPI